MWLLALSDAKFSALALLVGGVVASVLTYLATRVGKDAKRQDVQVQAAVTDTTLMVDGFLARLADADERNNRIEARLDECEERDKRKAAVIADQGARIDRLEARLDGRRR